MKDQYEDSKAFVKEMRILAKKRDLASLQRAVQQMQDWMRDYPDDLYVGTALEEFDILAEAAQIVEARNVSSPTDPIAKAS